MTLVSVTLVAATRVAVTLVAVRRVAVTCESVTRVAVTRESVTLRKLKMGQFGFVVCALCSNSQNTVKAEAQERPFSQTWAIFVFA